MQDSALEAADEDAPPPIEAIHTTDTDRWGAFVEQAASRKPSLRSVLANSRFLGIDGHRLGIELAAADRSLLGHLDQPEVVADLRDAARATWNRALLPVFTVGGILEPARMEDVPKFEIPKAAPVRAVSAKPAAASPPPDAGPTITLDEALSRHPELKAACELVEKHFGARPAAFNGERLRA